MDVKLPLSLALDPDRAQSDDLCEFEAGQRVDCPASSVIGRARAITPVLNRPLTGPVHFVKNVRRHPKTGRLIRTLPTLLIPLRGEVAINLRARTTVRRGKLVNIFPTIPDAPVSRFELTLHGGRRGILVVTRGRNLCRGRQIADVDIDGHNGKRSDRTTRMRTPCPKKRAAKLKLRKTNWNNNHLTVRGHINRRARRNVRITVRCGKTSASKRVKPNRGRWRATLTLPGRCTNAPRTRVTARYPGGPHLKRARAARKITKHN